MLTTTPRTQFAPILASIIKYNHCNSFIARSRRVCRCGPRHARAGVLTKTERKIDLESFLFVVMKATLPPVATHTPPPPFLPDSPAARCPWQSHVSPKGPTSSPTSSMLCRPSEWYAEFERARNGRPLRFSSPSFLSLCRFLPLCCMVCRLPRCVSFEKARARGPPQRSGHCAA